MRRSLREYLQAQLADWKMLGALEALDDVPCRCADGALAPGEAIAAMIGVHIERRNARRLQTAMRSARLPAVKTLASSISLYSPRSNASSSSACTRWGLWSGTKNVVLLGPPGVGKTHLALSLAMAAAQRRRRVYFTTLTDLLQLLEAA